MYVQQIMNTSDGCPYYWVLKSASNGNILAISSYRFSTIEESQRSAALFKLASARSQTSRHGIRTAVALPCYEVYEYQDGQFGWRLWETGEKKAQIAHSSEGYDSEWNAARAEAEAHSSPQI